MTRDQLLAIMPFAASRVERFLVPLNDAMTEFQITDRKSVV